MALALAFLRRFVVGASSGALGCALVLYVAIAGFEALRNATLGWTLLVAVPLAVVQLGFVALLAFGCASLALEQVRAWRAWRARPRFPRMYVVHVAHR